MLFMHHFILKNTEKMESSEADLLQKRIRMIGDLVSS